MRQLFRFGWLEAQCCLVHFTVGRRRYSMPLALSFGLIGFFLWVAET